MPHAGPLAAFDFIRPHGPLDLVEHRSAAAMLALPQLMLALVQVLETLCQVRAIFDRQGDQKGPQGRFLELDGLPPSQVGR